MDEGKVIAWRKREGDHVTKGEILFEVETDKANMEVEAPTDGFVRRILVPAGRMVPVATPIALIADSAEERLPDMAEALPEVAEALPEVAQATPPIADRFPSVAEGIASRPSIAAAIDGDRVRSSPAARKRAQELGVDINAVKGTGPGGRIGIEDVEAAARTPPLPAAAAGAGEKREPLSRMRRAVAAAMTRSAAIPQFSISRDIDMGAADQRRRTAGVSYTDVIVAACAQALRAHPRLGAHFDGDAVVFSESIDIGIAVALDEGLIVPVIRGADGKDLAALKREREELERAARGGRLPAHAMGPASLTVSNLGTFGADLFTALVNPPEAVILAVGRVADRVVARGGAPAVRPTMTATLSVDHRVADGADAARFLDDVAKQLEAT
jgi:pyruvate dehydrogenase E2 component (dihydrolipoamide acetyltransferase)